MALGLSEAIEAAESALGRGLLGDELAIVCRMHENGKEITDILTMLEIPAAPPPAKPGKKDKDGVLSYGYLGSTNAKVPARPLGDQ